MIPAMDISPRPRGKDGSSLSRNLHGSQKAIKNLKVTWSLHLPAKQFCKKTHFGLPEPIFKGFMLVLGMAFLTPIMLKVHD